MKNSMAGEVNAFIDTWGWVSLLSKREAKHSRVDNSYRLLRASDGLLYTTDDVLNETFTLLFRRLAIQQALYAIERTEEAVKSAYLTLEWIDETRFEKAKALRRKFLDKPHISFTDLTTMVVMSELKILDVLTEDDHFVQVGLGFRKVP